MNKAFKGDIGTEIIIDCQIDLSQATTLSIVARKPDGTKVVWTGSVMLPSSIRYVTLANDLDTIGTWSLQPKIESPAWTGSGATVELLVLPIY